MWHLLRTIPPVLMCLVLLKCVFVSMCIYLIDRHATVSSGIKIMLNTALLMSTGIWMMGLFYAWYLVHPAVK